MRQKIIPAGVCTPELQEDRSLGPRAPAGREDENANRQGGWGEERGTPLEGHHKECFSIIPRNAGDQRATSC